MAQLKNTNISDTGSFTLPQGTTAQRPISPTAGMIRYNTTINNSEYYDGAVWRPIRDSNPDATGGIVVDTDISGVPYRIHMFTSVGTSTFTVTRGGPVEFLIVAGGGSGGLPYGGGGGAGGIITGNTNVQAGNYTIEVGAGGDARLRTVGSVQTGDDGDNSSAFGITSEGGGGGGCWDSVAAPTTNPSMFGRDGGSGGGGGCFNNGSDGDTIAGGSGTPGQGNAGGVGTVYNNGGGGGGGGAGTPGNNSNFNGNPGNGGSGINSAILGTINFYSGGGGGGDRSNSGEGGIGGGGAGASGASQNGESGTPNTGGGGGGSGGSGQGANANTMGNSGAGGSGIIIIRYRRNNTVSESSDRVIESSQPNNFNVLHNGLVLHLDLSNPISYPGAGNTWFNLGSNNINGSFNSVSTNVNEGYVEFNSTSDSINFSNFNIPLEKTISFWLRTDRPLSSTDNWQIGFLDSVSTSGSNFGMMFGVGPTQDLGFWGYGSDYDLSIGSPSNRWIDRDAWNHITLTMDSSRNVRVYRNGVQQTLYRNSDGATALSFAMAVNTNDTFKINSRGPWNSGFSYLHLNDVLVYRRTLRNGEVESNFLAQRRKYGL